MHSSVARPSPLTTGRAVVSTSLAVRLASGLSKNQRVVVYAICQDIATNTAGVSSSFVRSHGIYK